MNTWWKVTAAAVLAVATVVTAYTVNGKAQATKPELVSPVLGESPAVSSTSNGTHPVGTTAPATDPKAQGNQNTHQDSEWITERAPVWTPPVKLGSFKGYCQDGVPVVTEAPPVTKTEWEEVRPGCMGDIFGTEHVVKWGPGRDATDPKNIAKGQPDFTAFFTLHINGNSIIDPRNEINVFPYVTKQGIYLVPAQWIVEAAGGEVTRTRDSRLLKGVWQKTVIELEAGKAEARVNGKPVRLEQAPTVVEGRMMVPANFFRDAYGAQEEWDSFNGILRMTIAGAECPPSYCFDRRFDNN